MAGFFFLALPLELRIKIYENLLYPDSRPPRELRRELLRRRGISVPEEGSEEYQAWVDHPGYHFDSLNHCGWPDCPIDERGPEWWDFFTTQDHPSEEDGSDGVNNEDDLKVIGAKVENQMFPIWDYVAHLYDFSCGRYWSKTRCSYGIDATILRANQQVYHEALPVLCRNIICEIVVEGYRDRGEHYILRQRYMRRYAEGLDDPREFHRDDEHDHRANPVVRQWTLPCKRLPNAEQALNLSCLWAIRNIRFTLVWEDELCRSRGPYQLSRVGRLLLEVLRYMEKEPIASIPIMKRFDIDLFGYGDMVNPFFVPLVQGSDAVDKAKGVHEGLKEIVSLLRNIRKSRVVSICDNRRPDSLSTCPELEIDPESFAWVEAW